MNHVDLVVAAVGMLVAFASVVLGAWLDLRPDRRSDERLEGREPPRRPAEATLGAGHRRAPRRRGSAR